MKVLIDTNIVLDVLLLRSPFVEQSRLVWQASDDARIEGCIAALTVPNIFYIVRRLVDGTRARECVGTCLEAFKVLPLDGLSIEAAFELNGSDFEDDLQIACGIAGGVEAVVTRDPKGFASAGITVFDPTSFVAQLG
jgi:predicted nucleic acid-binding protein